jgi:hypothetical protein
MTFLGIGPRNAKISVVAGASYAVLYLAIMAYILSGLPLNLPADRAIMSANPLIYLFAYLASFGNLTSRGMYVALGAAASFGLGAALVYAGFTQQDFPGIILTVLRPAYRLDTGEFWCVLAVL